MFIRNTQFLVVLKDIVYKNWNPCFKVLFFMGSDLWVNAEVLDTLGRAVKWVDLGGHNWVGNIKLITR